MGGLIYLLKLSSEVAGGGGDGRDAQGGAVPDDGVVEFGDGEVEAVAELVFHGAKDLPAVFEGLSVRISSSIVSLAMGIFNGRA